MPKLLLQQTGKVLKNLYNNSAFKSVQRNLANIRFKLQKSSLAFKDTSNIFSGWDKCPLRLKFY